MKSITEIIPANDLKNIIQRKYNKKHIYYFTKCKQI